MCPPAEQPGLSRLTEVSRLTLVVPANGVGGRAVYRQHGHQRHQHGYSVVKKEVPSDSHKVPLLMIQMHLYCNL